MDMSGLPPAFKYQILSMLGTDTLNKTLAVQPDERLEPVRFEKSARSIGVLNDDDKDAQRFFALKDLKALDSLGYIVRDSFLGDAQHVADVKREVEGLYATGELQQAGMSQGAQKWSDTRARGDIHLWLNDRAKYEETCPRLYALLDNIQALQQELNTTCGFNSEKTQVQVACYPGEGARYVRHLDACKASTSRRLTVLYYLNPSWTSEDGGQLRVYHDDTKSTDIDPLADRVVIFQSRTVEHEVLPAYKPRYALTMWFY